MCDVMLKEHLHPRGHQGWSKAPCSSPPIRAGLSSADSGGALPSAVQTRVTHRRAGLRKEALLKGWKMVLLYLALSNAPSLRSCHCAQGTLNRCTPEICVDGRLFFLQTLLSAPVLPTGFCTVVPLWFKGHPLSQCFLFA